MDDWKPGDMALCIAPEGPLVSGQIYTVDNAFWDDGSTGCPPGLGLDLCEFPHGWDAGLIYGFATGFDAWRFIKPPPAADEFDREVIELMNGVSAPNKEPAQ